MRNRSTQEGNSTDLINEELNVENGDSYNLNEEKIPDCINTDFDSMMGEVEFYDESGIRRTISVVAVIPDTVENTGNSFAIDKNLIGLFNSLIHYL